MKTSIIILLILLNSTIAKAQNLDLTNQKTLTTAKELIKNKPFSCKEQEGTIIISLK